ncbi:energy transducer TonB [Novosphingobium soli]|uniref:Protein TonB n=1 Tax=Novosphingobium soli TaxID=574956 RepID=A0ABV6CU93_9SPHN
MATLAANALEDLARTAAPPRVPEEPAVRVAPLRADSFVALEAPRSVYRPARANPVAIVASVAVIAGMAACLATLNIVAAHEEHRRLTVVDVRELDVTPPPPPPEQPKAETPPAAQTQSVAPKPLIELPGPGPQQVMVEAPPPPAPPTVTSEGVKAEAPPAPAPAPATTAANGDLSSTLLFAKPPVYPVEARRAHAEGTVKLWVVVGIDGHVAEIRVARSSGSAALDRAALQAVKRWRWKPSKAGDAGLVTIPFTIIA